MSACVVLVDVEDGQAIIRVTALPLVDSSAVDGTSVAAHDGKVAEMEAAAQMEAEAQAQHGIRQGVESPRPTAVVFSIDTMGKAHAHLLVKSVACPGGSTDVTLSASDVGCGILNPVEDDDSPYDNDFDEVRGRHYPCYHCPTHATTTPSPHHTPTILPPQPRPTTTPSRNASACEDTHAFT
jgi:hypothetical protein